MMVSVTGAEGATLTATNEDQEVVEWQLNAQKVSTFNDAEVIEAEGDVVLQHGNDTLKADFARYYIATNWVFLSGNVKVQMNDDKLTATTAEFDLGKKVGWLRDGKIFMADPHLYFSGSRIQKNWGDSYSFRNAKITACDGDRPAWSFETNNAKLELEGYAVINGADIAIKDVPVLPVPYMVLPVKTRREAGFLRPKFGTTTRLGFWYHQPFFLPIDQERDITLDGLYMADRGFMPGIELRARPSANTQFWGRFDWLDDAKKVTNLSEANDLDFDSNLLRTNSNRYWARGMFNGEFPDPRWKVRADIDYVSDQDYLREFNETPSGFDGSQHELESRFGRTLNDISDPIRTSRLLFTRDWNRVGGALLGEYNQNSAIGHGNEDSSEDTTLQRLPEFDFYIFKNRMPGLENIPLTLTGDFQTVQFERNKGTKGNRIDVVPMLGLPLVTSYGTITPEVGVQQLWYNTANEDPLTPDMGDDSRDARTLFRFNVDGYSEVARVYQVDSDLKASEENVGDSEITALKHAIQPRFQYNHVGGSTRKDAPEYDYVDRIDKERELTVSLVNLITKREETVVAGDSENGVAPSLRKSYGELLWFRVLQSYDFEEKERDPVFEGYFYETRPWSELEAELRFYPISYVTWTSRSFYNYYDSQVNRHDHTLTLTAPKYGSFSTGVDFRQNLDKDMRFAGTDITDLNTWKNTLVVEFLNPLQFEMYYEYDFERNETFEQSYTVSYNHQCFRLIFYASFTPLEDSYKFYIEIPGLTF